jgi:hypothetical protein
LIAIRPVGPGHAQLVLGFRVVGLEVLQRERPVEQVSPVDLSVLGSHPEFVRLETQAGARPVHRGAADGLADPCRQAWKVFSDAPAARRGPLVEPRKLAERRPLVVDEALAWGVLPGLEQHDLDAFLAQLIGERAPAGAGADDDNDPIIA